jgi:hypothetical protein
MEGRTAARALAVLVGAGTLIVVSQGLAGDRPPAPTQLDASRSTTTTTTSPRAAGSSTTSAPATTSTVPLPPIAGPVRLDERSRFDGRGVGPVEAGMTVGEAEQAAGRRFEIERDDDGAACYAATVDGLPGLRVTVKGPAGDPREGKVVKVEASDSTWATVSDVRLGSTEAEVRRAYGSRAMASADATTYTVSVKDGGQSYAVVFVMSERKVVTSLRSGEAAAVAAPEGCG